MTDLEAQKTFFREILDRPPVDTTYVAGRWHHDRVTLSGFWTEARVYAKSLMVPPTQNKRFLIITRARSGSTLLTRLLDAHSQIRCDAEIMSRNVALPGLFFARSASKSQAPVYGAKLLSYQMVQVQRMRRPDKFVARMAQAGVQIIHLKRDTFDQTLSLAIAQQRDQYHSDAGAKPIDGKIHFDPADFLRRLQWSETLLQYETMVLENINPLVIQYETDLKEADSQQHTVDRLCAALDLPTEQVSVSLKKVLPKHPEQIIANYDEICAHLTENSCAHLVPAAPNERIAGV